MTKFLDAIDTLNDYLGRVFRFTLVALAAIMCFEVFSRYVIHRPTTWAFEVSTGLYGATFMLCGAYALLYKSHVTIDLLYEKFGLKGKAILDLVSYVVFFYPFVIVLLKEGLKYAGESWAIKETTWSTFPMPLYIIKTCIPLFAILVGLQGTVTVIRAVMSLVTKEDWYAKCRYKKEEIPRVIMDDSADGKGE